MSKVETDKRTIRTKKMIRDALSELIEEKGLNNISVIDLTKRANINRGTFYLHYTDKFDLVDKLENEIILELEILVKTSVPKIISDTNPLNQLVPYNIKIFNFLKENSKFIKAILGSNGDPSFRSKLKRFFIDTLFDKEILNIIKKETLLIPEDYFLSYLIAAHLSIVGQWFEKGMKESPEEMALILAQMSLLGPFKVAGLE